MRHRVFISDTARDADVAADLCRRIERRGVSCWIAPRDIMVGEDFALRVIKAIETSKVFAIVLSAHTDQSDFVKSEAARAYTKKVPIFPLRVENVEPGDGLLFYFSRMHWIDAFGPRRFEGLDRFVDAVVAKATQVKGHQTTAIGANA